MKQRIFIMYLVHVKRLFFFFGVLESSRGARGDGKGDGQMKIKSLIQKPTIPLLQGLGEVSLKLELIHKKEVLIRVSISCLFIQIMVRQNYQHLIQVMYPLPSIFFSLIKQNNVKVTSNDNYLCSKMHKLSKSHLTIYRSG